MIKVNPYWSRRGVLWGASGALGVAALPRKAFAASSSPVVETQYGKVQGFVKNGIEHYFGVPYGGSVSGARRFRAPQPVAPWAGSRDCTAYGPASIQPMGTILSANDSRPAEDCLVLNVWTPASDGGRRPVMFYSHGGGFSTGSGSSKSQDGGNLARYYDVVVVETNHRLGLLGYLYLSDLPGARGEVDANCGLLDIVAGLRWVQQNIERFGGDPNRVMIFGESGGGAKTSCLYAMPSAQSLFHRASIESGPAIRIGTLDSANRLTARVLSELNIATRDWRKVFEVPAETLLAVQQKVSSVPDNTGASAGFSLPIQPVVDGTVMPAHPFDPAPPSFSRNKPLIVGYNHDESVFFHLMDKSVFSLDEAGLKSRLASQMRAPEEAIAVYRESRPGATPTQLYIAITSAMFAGMGSIQIAERKAAQGGAPVYTYVFNYQLEGRVPGTDYPIGAMHASEITFKFFNMEGVSSRGLANLSGSRPERIDAGRNMSGLWTSFARTGTPAAAGVPTWVPYDTSSRSTMIIDSACRLEKDPYRLEREFWSRRTAKSE